MDINFIIIDIIYFVFLKIILISSHESVFLILFLFYITI